MRLKNLQEYAKQRGISVHPITAESEYRYKISVPIYGQVGGALGWRVRKANTLKEAKSIVDGYWADPVFQANVKRAAAGRGGQAEGGINDSHNSHNLV